jgi:hypothetical protein
MKVLPAPVPPVPPYSILFAGANKKLAQKLALENEVRQIQNAFIQHYGSWSWGDNVIFKHSFFTSGAGLSRSMRDCDPVCLHLSCHGKPNTLALYGQELTAKALVNFIASWCASGARLQLIVLNACCSAEIAYALSEHVDFVIGHSTPVYDADAVNFSRELYGHLGMGNSLELSFNAAKMASNNYHLLGRKDASKFRLCPPNVPETAPAVGNVPLPRGWNMRVSRSLREVLYFWRLQAKRRLRACRTRHRKAPARVTHPAAAAAAAGGSRVAERFRRRGCTATGERRWTPPPFIRDAVSPLSPRSVSSRPSQAPMSPDLGPTSDLLSSRAYPLSPVCAAARPQSALSNFTQNQLGLGDEMSVFSGGSQADPRSPTLHSIKAEDDTPSEMISMRSPDGEGMVIPPWPDDLKSTISKLARILIEGRQIVCTRAEFGLQADPEKANMVVRGKVVRAVPWQAQHDLENAEEMKGAIALIGRGGCQFTEKARRSCETNTPALPLPRT